MSSRTILINTAPDGTFAYERPFFGLVNAVMLDVGTLDLGSLDVVLTDTVQDVDLHEFGELAGDAFWQPDPPAAVYGSLLVTVTNGGDSRHGRLHLMTET